MGEIFNSWIAVLTHPSVETFDAQKPGASRSGTIVSIVLAAIVSAVLGAIFTLIFVGVASSLVPNLGTPLLVGPTATIRAFVSGLINTIVGFFIFAYILNWIAKQFGGTGEFDEEAYLVAIAYSPIIIISSILNFIPIIGQIIALVLFIYLIVLITFAVRSGQRISTWPAVGSWIIAGIVTGIVISIIGGLTGGWL